MDGYEYLELCQSAKKRYKAELKRLADDFIKTNISFKVGDIVEMKNYVMSGTYIVDKIFMNVDDDFDAVQSPQCYIYQIQVEGRKLNNEGHPMTLSSRFKATDIIRVK